MSSGNCKQSCFGRALLIGRRPIGGRDLLIASIALAYDSPIYGWFIERVDARDHAGGPHTLNRGG